MWSKYIHFYPKEGEKKSQRTHEHHFKKISINESRQEISLFGVSYFWIHIQHSQSHGGRDIKRMVFWLKGWVNVNASGISCEQSETLCLPTWFWQYRFTVVFACLRQGLLEDDMVNFDMSLSFACYANKLLIWKYNSTKIETHYHCSF